MKRVLLAAAAIIVAGCVTVSDEVTSARDVGGDDVMLVGKIELVPPLKPDEQKYRAWDPMNSKRYFMGRAILFTDDKPEYRERTGHALNPPLEQTFFVKLPKAHRYVVKGSVTMTFASNGSSARSGFDQSELLFPVPIQLDVRPGDKAIYIGTLRLHRDEFHEVTKAELRDDYAAAIKEYRKRFTDDPLPRKALLKRR